MTGTAVDRQLATALGVLLDRLSRLPTDSDRFGATHGDFELDNLAWTGDRPTAFDFDEAARSWYLADIALDAGTEPTDPPWLTALRHRLDNHTRHLRLAVVRHARS
jgi:Ser/Thr protein kinase RdoA (MazF antagonist)